MIFLDIFDNKFRYKRDSIINSILFDRNLASRKFTDFDLVKLINMGITIAR